MTKEMLFTAPKVERSLICRISDYCQNAIGLERIKKEWCVQGAFNALASCKMSLTDEAHSQKELVGAFILSGVEGGNIIKDSSRTRTQNGGYSNTPMHIIKLRNYSIQITEHLVDPVTHIRISVIGCSYQHVDVTFCNPMDVAQAVIAVDSMIPTWLREIWSDAVLKGSKKAKMRNVKETAIEMMLRSKCGEVGIPFSMVKQKIRVKVLFDIGHNSMVEMALSHKHFMDQIDGVVATVMSLKRLADDLGCPIKIKKLNTAQNWI